MQRLIFVLSSMDPIIVKEDSEASGIYKNDVYFNPGKYYDDYFMDQTIKLPFRKLKNIHIILQTKVEKHDIDQILKEGRRQFRLFDGWLTTFKTIGN